MDLRPQFFIYYSFSTLTHNKIARFSAEVSKSTRVRCSKTFKFEMKLRIIRKADDKTSKNEQKAARKRFPVGVDKNARRFGGPVLVLKPRFLLAEPLLSRIVQTVAVQTCCCSIVQTATLKKWDRTSINLIEKFRECKLFGKLVGKKWANFLPELSKLHSVCSEAKFEWIYIFLKVRRTQPELGNHRWKMSFFRIKLRREISLKFCLIPG